MRQVLAWEVCSDDWHANMCSMHSRKFLAAGALRCEVCDLGAFKYCDHPGCGACDTCATGRVSNSAGSGCADCANAIAANVGELKAHRRQLLLRLHDRRRRGCRAVYLCDSGAGVGALAKGRSSAVLMNSELRKCAAIRFCGGYRDFYIWCASEDNPSDFPSRKYPSKMRVRPGPTKSAPQHHDAPTPSASSKACAQAEPNLGLNKNIFSRGSIIWSEIPMSLFFARS